MKENNEIVIPILQDTREQDPLLFNNYPVKIYKDTLKAGDYSIVGHDMPEDDFSVIIERKKNCSELIGNIGAKWDAFEREAEFLSKYRYRQIVVCGPNNFDWLIEKGFTKLSLNFIYKRLACLSIDYNIQVVFCPDRVHAENYIFRIFKEIMGRMRDEQ